MLSRCMLLALSAPGASIAVTYKRHVTVAQLLTRVSPARHSASRKRRLICVLDKTLPFINGLKKGLTVGEDAFDKFLCSPRGRALNLPINA